MAACGMQVCTVAAQSCGCLVSFQSVGGGGGDGVTETTEIIEVTEVTLYLGIAVSECKAQ